MSVDSARCCVMLTWMLIYTARPVLAAIQTSHRRRRRHAATVTPRERPQSREAPVWLVIISISYFIVHFSYIILLFICRKRKRPACFATHSAIAKITDYYRLGRFIYRSVYLYHWKLPKGRIKVDLGNTFYILVVEVDIRCPYLVWWNINPRKSTVIAFVPRQSIIVPNLRRSHSNSNLTCNEGLKSLLQVATRDTMQHV